MNYAFRITRSFEELNGLFNRLSEVSTGIIIYEHNTNCERTHIHGYVENLTISTDTFKNWVKKELGVEQFDKHDWEFATKIAKGVDKGKPVNRNSIFYFHKGEYPVKFMKGFPEELITIKHAESVAFYSREQKHEVRVSEVIVVDKKKSVKPTQWEIAQEVKRQMMNDEGEFETRVREIVKLTIRTLKQNRMLAHKRLIANIVQDIRADFDRERYINDVMALI